MNDEDNETWLLDVGAGIVQKKARVGYSALSPVERLTYCLWVADYGMRNAGDLVTARDLHSAFFEDARSAAIELGLARTREAFSLSVTDLEHRYFALFDSLCREIRTSQTE